MNQVAKFVDAASAGSLSYTPGSHPITFFRTTVVCAMLTPALDGNNFWTIASPNGADSFLAYPITFGGGPGPYGFLDAAAGGPAGTLPADVWFTAVYEATYSGTGTLWDITLSVEGVTVLTASGVDLFTDGSTIGPNQYIGFSSFLSFANVHYVKSMMLEDDTGVEFFDDFSSNDFSAWTTVNGNVSLVDDPFGPPDFHPGSRFFEGFPWRFIFTAVDVSDPFNPVVTQTTSWADGLLTNRQISKALGQSTTIESDVWPDDIRVNEIWTDGYPRVAQTKRMVWAFRREAPEGGPPWVIRAAGQLLSPSDDGGPDVPLSHFVAYDPRTWLAARPATDETGALPDPSTGFTIPGPGNVTALTFLKNTIVNEGSVFIDAGVAYGGTAFYGGTIETTDDVVVTVQGGQSVADVWATLEQAGNCDIILEAIYDPVNRPGYTHEVSVYALAGADKPQVVMGWDLLNRCLNRVQRVHDGTPGAFFDKVQAYAGQGGAPVPALGPLVNGAAVTDFGAWWLLQFFPAMLSTDPTAAAVLALATQALQLAKQGRRTLTLDVITELAPRVFNAYDLGDRVNVHATKRMRATIDGLQRIEAIPLQIPDDGVGEKIAALLTSPDWRGSGDS